MPDTFLGLAILVLLLMPGVIFAIQADSRRPAHDLSSLRELITIAGVGTICDVVVLLVFGLLRIWFPRDTPDIGKLARQGSIYTRAHFQELAWWTFGLFVAACLLAWALGRFRPGIAGRAVAGKIYATSGWWEMFHAQPKCRNYVSCTLTDGSYMAGYLMRYSTKTDETADRDLVIAGPVQYRGPGQATTSELQNVHAVSLRAAQIKYLAVTYLEVQQESATNPEWSRKFTGRRYRAELTRLPR
jgi:hypothetical protein